MKRFAAVCTCVVAGLLTTASPAFAGLGDVETPTVTPIPTTATDRPWQSTDIDLSQYGYREDEYIIAGDAFAYGTAADPLATAPKITTGGPDGDGSYPYVTRIIVRRPANSANFNGTTVVEWLNVTSTFDLEANWHGDPYYLLKNGYAWVGVSAQRVGVTALKTFKAARYPTLDIPDPNEGNTTPGVDHDALSFEIYSAAVKALLGAGNGVDPLGGLNPQTVIASGESQSGSRLALYHNAIQPTHELVDAFLITVATRALRTDRPEKVVRILSENETKTTQVEADNSNLRHWEVAGASHLPELAYRNFRGPVERDLGFTLVANCQKTPLSRVQWPYVANAATAYLDRWADGGAAPPAAPRQTYSAPNTLARDPFGISQGAIRLPEVTVPVATNTGINVKQPTSTDLFSNFCPLLGSYEILPQATIDGLYADFADYIDKVRADATTVSGQGFVLPEDVPRLVSDAEAFPQVRPTAPVRSAGSRRNRGVMTLTWRGTTAPATTFELQRSAKGSAKWQAVGGAGAVPGDSFAFTRDSRERQGKWTYRVRNTTTVPATPIAPAYVVTTSFSDPSGLVVVDRTKPKLRVTCPKRVKRGVKAFARIRASDPIAGLRRKPKARVRLRTGKLGKRTVKRTVVDKVGNRRTDRCVTRVVRR